MGYAWLFVLGIAAAAALRALGVPRTIWSLAAAALMLGAAGYAWQGSPTLAGRATAPDTRAIDSDPDLIALRDRMFGARFTNDGAYLIAADAMTRSGDPASGAAWLLSGIRKVPDSALLWTGLGDTLAIHDGNRVSPPALFAFRRAMRIAPAHPGPPFFLGLAYVRAGDFPAAERAWRRALTLTPAEADYREGVALRLALLDRVLASPAIDGSVTP